jgi:hypothetical protein
LISDVRSEAHIKRLETIVATYRQCQTLQGALAYAYAASNQTDRAGEILHGLEQTIGTKKRQHGYGLAIALIGLKREQEAALWLEVEYAEGSLWSLGFGSDPVLQSLRGDRRYEALARKIGNSARSGAAARQPVVALARAV